MQRNLFTGGSNDQGVQMQTYYSLILDAAGAETGFYDEELRPRMRQTGPAGQTRSSTSGSARRRASL